jgi:hypothetical protein
MRKEGQIKAEIDALVTENHDKRETITNVAQGILTAKVIALRQELADLYSDGAKPCPKCGAKPLGMDRATKYEVGCTFCPPVQLEPVTIDGIKVNQRQSYSSQGRTPEAAVENWNNDVYIIDTKD